MAAKKKARKTATKLAKKVKKVIKSAARSSGPRKKSGTGKKSKKGKTAKKGKTLKSVVVDAVAEVRELGKKALERAEEFVSKETPKRGRASKASKSR
jgi:hypothetical protein